MPVYNKEAYAFQIKTEIPENKQVLAMPLKKPSLFKPREIEVVSDPLTLVGHKPDTIQDFFGTPTRTRNDNDSQIWQYYSKNCAMDVFFYNEAEAQKSLVVEYIDIRAMNSESKDECVDYFMDNSAVALKKLDDIQYSLKDASSL